MNLHKEYSVFGPWIFLREDGPTFHVHGYLIEYLNGQWVFHHGPEQIRVKKVTTPEQLGQHTPSTKTTTSGRSSAKSIPTIKSKTCLSSIYFKLINSFCKYSCKYYKLL